MLTPLLSQLFRWLPGMSKFHGSSLVSFVQEVINNEEEEGKEVGGGGGGGQRGGGGGCAKDKEEVKDSGGERTAS